MKLGIALIEGATRVVLRGDGEVIDLTSAIKLTADGLPAFLGRGAEAIAQCQRALRSAQHALPLAHLTFSKPVARPDKLIGIGMNYRSFVEAAQAAGMPVPSDKIWFLRPASCLAGPHDPVWLPQGEYSLDYEVELAVIVGRRCRRVSSAEAQSAIAGFTVANDLTLRERVRKSITLAKAFETHTPIGPWIVTPEEIDGQRLRVRSWVNGELRQDSTTAEMIVPWPDLIAELSASFVLNPGDVLLTGTPSGSGVFHNPPRWLHAGDRVRLEIEGIGTLENQILDEPA